MLSKYQQKMKKCYFCQVFETLFVFYITTYSALPSGLFKNPFYPMQW